MKLGIVYACSYGNCSKVITLSASGHGKKYKDNPEEVFMKQDQYFIIGLHSNYLVKEKLSETSEMIDY